MGDVYLGQEVGDVCFEAIYKYFHTLSNRNEHNEPKSSVNSITAADQIKCASKLLGRSRPSPCYSTDLGY